MSISRTPPQHTDFAGLKRPLHPGDSPVQGLRITMEIATVTPLGELRHWFNLSVLSRKGHWPPWKDRVFGMSWDFWIPHDDCSLLYPDSPRSGVPQLCGTGQLSGKLLEVLMLTQLTLWVN
jgi:hypothetical protein